MTAPKQNGEQLGTDDADFAKAFQELSRGEQTASALESQLDAMEAKINELLKAAEQNQKDIDESRASNATTNGTKK